MNFKDDINFLTTVRKFDYKILKENFEMPFRNYMYYIVNEKTPFDFQFIFNSSFMHLLANIMDVDMNEYYNMTNDYYKKLFFLNPILNSDFDYDICFNEYPDILTDFFIGWVKMFSVLITYNKKRYFKFLRRMLKYTHIHNNIMLYLAYHASSYLDTKQMLEIKKLINVQFKLLLPKNYTIQNKPNKIGKPKIAVLSDYRILTESNVVYKHSKLWLDIFKKHFNITLITNHTFNEKFDYSYYDDVLVVPDTDLEKSQDYKKIIENEFHFAWCPSIGGNPIILELVLLNFTKIITGYSHPYSSGLENIIMIASKDCETSESNYVEQIKYISGLTTVPRTIEKRRTLRTENRQILNKSTFITDGLNIMINCAWIKITEEDLEIYKYINKNTKGSVKFHILPGNMHDIPCAFNIIEKTFKSLDIENFEIYYILEQDEVYNLFNNCDLAISPIHGNFTCFLECLQCNIPPFFYKGGHVMQKQQTYISNMAGLDELGTLDMKDYILKYTNNEHLLKTLRNKIINIDMNEILERDKPIIESELTALFKSF